MISATDNYGLSKLSVRVLPVSALQERYAYAEDAFIAEIIDPETCEVLPPGSVGELVLTTISKEAFPMIRYRTRDIHFSRLRCLRMRPHHGQNEEKPWGGAMTC